MPTPRMEPVAKSLLRLSDRRHTARAWESPAPILHQTLGRRYEGLRRWFPPPLRRMYPSYPPEARRRQLRQRQEIRTRCVLGQARVVHATLSLRTVISYPSAAFLG